MRSMQDPKDGSSTGDPTRESWRTHDTPGRTGSGSVCVLGVRWAARVDTPQLDLETGPLNLFQGGKDDHRSWTPYLRVRDTSPTPPVHPSLHPTWVRACLRTEDLPRPRVRDEGLQVTRKTRTQGTLRGDGNEVLMKYRVCSNLPKTGKIVEVPLNLLPGLSLHRCRTPSPHLRCNVSLCPDTPTLIHFRELDSSTRT